MKKGSLCAVGSVLCILGSVPCFSAAACGVFLGLVAMWSARGFDGLAGIVVACFGGMFALAGCALVMGAKTLWRRGRAARSAAGG